MRQTVFLKHVLAVTALLVISLPSWAFIAQTREGVNMTFHVISEDDKTCEVGDGLNTSNAIDVSYSGSLTIPETANGYTVISIDGHSFDGCSGLTSITIPETVTNIHDDAFSGCAFTEPIYNSRFFVFLPRSYVGEYVLPQTIKTICRYAFCDCYDLTSVIIPEGVIDIRGEAFYGCSSLTSLTLPESLTSIGGMCIGCPVTSINIPESLTSVGYGAFFGCSELKDPAYNSRFFVRLPKSYEGGYVIPQTIETICDGAFNGCSGLTSVTISKNVSSIGEMGLFGNATNLNTIIVSAENSNYDSRNSCNAIIEKATNTLVAGCKTTVIPNTVTKIATSAFGDCIGLTSIIIPSSVTSTGDYVFQGCTGLTTVEMSSNQATIEIGTFNGCASLTSINIPDGVTCIRGVAFSNSGLTSVTIPQSVTTIEGEAFSGCSSLTSITVESGNSYYDSRDNCNAIIETSTNKLIQGCANTIIPNSVTSIGDAAFANSGLTSITIPSSVTSIGGGTFDNCSCLASVVVKNSTPVTIDENTFSNRSNATLYVPAGSKSAYENADYWKEFGRIVEGVPLVDGETFSYNTDMVLEEITYTRTYKKSAWLSWYVPFDLTLTSDVLNNFSFAKFCGSYTEEDGNGDDVFCITVSRLKAGDVVKANTPYVVKAKTASNDPQVITVTNATLKAAEERVLNMYSAEKKISIKGIYSSKNATEQDCDWYFINSTGYVHAQAGQTLGANRLFMTITDREDNLYANTPNPNNVKLKVLDDDEETSLEELATDDGLQTTEHAVYDLSGRRILNDKLESGIYIINGKKVLVK